MSAVLTSLADSVLTITLNRPDKRNAWNGAMEEGLRRALVDASAPEVRVIVLTGAGSAFCAGADGEFLKELQSGNARISDKADNPWPKARSEFRGKFAMPAAVPKPVIAAVNGPAVGIGYVLALFCDIRIACEDAAFIGSFSRMGLIAEKGIDWMLAGLVGRGRATEILLSGRKVGAVEAERIGLVTAVHAPGDFAASVQGYAKELATKVSPRSAAVIKRQLQGTAFDSPQEILERGEAELARSLASDDFREAMVAMREKRPPSFPPL